jgi:hypothetical protein
MGEKKDHLTRLSELSEKILALAESIKGAEKDMQATWIDKILRRETFRM